MNKKYGECAYNAHWFKVADWESLSGISGEFKGKVRTYHQDILQEVIKA